MAGETRRERPLVDAERAIVVEGDTETVKIGNGAAAGIRNVIAESRADCASRREPSASRRPPPVPFAATAMHRGQAVSRSAIVEQVWKLNFDTMTNVVDVYINYLRRKIDFGFDRILIRTVRGVGYQITLEPEVRAHALAAC